MKNQDNILINMALRPLNIDKKEEIKEERMIMYYMFIKLKTLLRGKE